MLYWGSILAIAVVISFILIIVIYKRAKTCNENELELFEVMNESCEKLDVGTTGVKLSHSLLSLVAGATYTITGAFKKTTLHIIPRTEKNKADTENIHTIKFGCWQSICEIDKVEINAREVKKVTITAYNKSANAAVTLNLLSSTLGLYHYIPSTAAETDTLSIVKS